MPIEKLNEQEKFWIAYYDTFENGYNSTSGGSALYTTRYKKLDLLEVNEVINLLKNSNLSQEDIAQQYNVNQHLISDINLGVYSIRPDCNYPIRQQHELLQRLAKHNYCVSCGAEITITAKQCVSCLHKSQFRCSRPSRDELKRLIRTQSFLAIGKQYNVSDNAIRKWCKSMNLPSKKSVINSLTETEWNDI